MQERPQKQSEYTQVRIFFIDSNVQLLKKCTRGRVREGELVKLWVESETVEREKEQTNKFVEEYIAG